MHLKGRDKKLVLYCTFSERDFPISLKGRWSAKFKGWTFSPSMMSYNTITDKAKEDGVDLNISEDVFNYFNRIEVLYSMQGLNKEFKTTPYQHQELITAMILQKKKCFVFAGVGTGKSKAAIDAVTYMVFNMAYAPISIAGKKARILYNHPKVLVVSPSSIMWNFGNEITTHSELDYTVITGSLTKRKQLLEDSSTVFDIINYEIIEKLEYEINKKGYDMIIFDEIHYCKNRNSNRSKSSYKIAKNIPRRVGLTGTIISNSYEDLFMPYKIIDDAIFGIYYTKFKDRYFRLGGFHNHEIIGYRNENEIKSMVAMNSIKFEIRDVIDNLPSEKNIIKSIHLSPKSKKIYKELKTHMLIEHERGDIVASNVLERLIRMSQITSGFLVDKENSIIEDIGQEKIEVLKEILTEISEKAAIFCRFRRSIDRVVALCEKLRLSYYVYDGRTKEKDLYLKFNTDDTKVWIAQIQKSEGYSIPSAQYCIFYELDYSRKNHIQSRGRILRAVGSKHDCIFYIYLIADSTIDEAVYKTLEDKDFNSKQALELVKGV